MTEIIAIATALAFVGLGGGLYEFSVIDPFWPRRPDLIQPSRGADVPYFLHEWSKRLVHGMTWR